MADERKQKTAESRLNDVFAGDDELGRDRNEPRRDEKEPGDRKPDDNLRDVDSVTAIPADDRAMHDDRATRDIEE
jgi:hypothetical protein